MVDSGFCKDSKYNFTGRERPTDEVIFIEPGQTRTIGVNQIGYCQRHVGDTARCKIKFASELIDGKKTPLTIVSIEKPGNTMELDRFYRDTTGNFVGLAKDYQMMLLAANACQ